MHTFLTQKLTPFLRFVRESDFWSTILLWILIAAICVAVSNVVAA
jgi:ABC-type sulfate transport system permease subunit